MAGGATAGATAAPSPGVPRNAPPARCRASARLLFASKSSRSRPARSRAVGSEVLEPVGRRLLAEFRARCTARRRTSRRPPGSRRSTARRLPRPQSLATGFARHPQALAPIRDYPSRNGNPTPPGRGMRPIPQGVCRWDIDCNRTEDPHVDDPPPAAEIFQPQRLLRRPFQQARGRHPPRQHRHAAVGVAGAGSARGRSRLTSRR